MTAYEMRISDWSSDVCSSDLRRLSPDAEAGMSLFTAEQVIFVVDDDAALREANVQTLDLAGLTAEAFADAHSVLPRIAADFPGAVVTDIRMPGMDGLELRAAIHAIDPEIPVILITEIGRASCRERVCQYV